MLQYTNDQYEALRQQVDSVTKSLLNTVAYDWRERFGDEEAMIMVLDFVIRVAGGIAAGFGHNGGPQVQRDLATIMKNGIDFYVEEAIRVIADGRTDEFVRIEPTPIAPTVGRA